MKKALLLSILMLPCLLFSQSKVDSLQILADGLNGYRVMEVPGTAQELHAKATKWIKYNFKTPDEVIKSSVDGELLRCEMYYPLGITFRQGNDVVGINYRQTLEMLFKDGRIKYTILYYTISNGAIEYYTKGTALNMSFYNMKGKPRKRAAVELQSSNVKMNAIYQDLRTFITQKNETKW